MANVIGTHPTNQADFFAYGCIFIGGEDSSSNNNTGICSLEYVWTVLDHDLLRFIGIHYLWSLSVSSVYFWSEQF